MIFMGIRKDKLKYMFNDIKIGPVTFHMYGLMIAIGFAAALMMCLKRGKKRGLNEDIIYGIFLKPQKKQCATRSPLTR
jgi:phosphatidylglycerol:prolipoprotein diacylglycerol transferase